VNSVPINNEPALFQTGDTGYNISNGNSENNTPLGNPEGKTVTSEDGNDKPNPATQGLASANSGATLGETPRPEDVTTQLRQNAKFSGTALQAQQRLLDNPRGLKSSTFGQPTSSIYIDRDGTVSILKPHTHEEVARNILGATTNLDVPDESPGHDEWVQTFLQKSLLVAP